MKCAIAAQPQPLVDPSTPGDAIYHSGSSAADAPHARTRPVHRASASSYHVDVSLSRAPVAAVTLIALILAVQTITPSDWMPALVQSVLAAWVEFRADAIPLTSTVIGCFCVYASTDALTQCLTARSREPSSREVTLDLTRMARSGFTSAMLSGFLAVYYFRMLERATAGLGRWASVAAKVCVDVGCYEPIYDTLYITMQALLRGEGLPEARAEVEAKVLKVWAMAPRYWCFADTINFGFVDLRLRPLVNALLSVPWSMFISHMANSEVAPAGEGADAGAADGRGDEAAGSARRRRRALAAAPSGPVAAAA